MSDLSQHPVSHPSSSTSNLSPQALSAQALQQLQTHGHYPVLHKEVHQYAQAKSGEIWIDCTMGRGGHALALAQQGASVIALDQDLQAIELISQNPMYQAIQPVHGNFREIKKILKRLNIQKVDGILADLGVSSPQLDQADRGFSFRFNAPLDMRMDRTQGLTALEWIRSQKVEEITRVLRDYGEEPFAFPIAKMMKNWATQNDEDLGTTALANAIAQIIPMKVQRQKSIHPATLSFQALRIAVNDELSALETLLADAPSLLKDGGKFLVISFHSLEDRLVKKSFQALTSPLPAPRRGLPPPNQGEIEFKLLFKGVVDADEQELSQNPRSRSAKLRGVIKQK
jgi:16S rRNA (cytosine1402-N4)-methyltransferase